MSVLSVVMFAAQCVLIWMAWRDWRRAKNAPPTIEHRVGEEFLRAYRKVREHTAFTGEECRNTVTFALSMNDDPKVYVALSNRELAE